MTSSTCTNATWDCGSETCNETVICPKNQIWLKDVTPCSLTCEDVGREPQCVDTDYLYEGCGCEDGFYLSPTVRTILFYTHIEKLDRRITCVFKLTSPQSTVLILILTKTNSKLFSMMMEEV